MPGTVPGAWETFMHACPEEGLGSQCEHSCGCMGVGVRQFSKGITNICMLWFVRRWKLLWKNKISSERGKFGSPGKEDGWLVTSNRGQSEGLLEKVEFVRGNQRWGSKPADKWGEHSRRRGQPALRPQGAARSKQGDHRDQEGKGLVS